MGRGFADYARRSGLTVWACAILPDHVHVVTARFRLTVERVIIQLKGAATRQLQDEGIHPFQRVKIEEQPKCFARGEWKVYLETVDDIQRAIEYVEGNPMKEGKPPQRWSFVTRFEPTCVDNVTGEGKQRL